MKTHCKACSCALYDGDCLNKYCSYEPEATVSGKAKHFDYQLSNATYPPLDKAYVPKARPLSEAESKALVAHINKVSDQIVKATGQMSKAVKAGKTARRDGAPKPGKYDKYVAPLRGKPK